jgi:hypothetical protein
MSGSSHFTMRMRGSSASFTPQESQDVKPLLVEVETDVEVPYPTAAAVLADPLSSSPSSFKDPFYENDASVIAAFTFDYDRLDRGLARTGRVLVGTSLLFLVLSLLFPVVVTIMVMFPIWFLLCFIALHFSDRSKQYRRRCLHIAVAEFGIYLDEVSEPGSAELMRRLQYKYAEISRCEVSRTNCCGNVTFQVVLFNAKGWPMLQLAGLLGAQRFVDLVNDMIERTPKNMATIPVVPRTMEVI